MGKTLALRSYSSDVLELSLKVTSGRKSARVVRLRCGLDVNIGVWLALAPNEFQMFHLMRLIKGPDFQATMS